MLSNRQDKEYFKTTKTTTKRQLWSLQKQHNFLKRNNGYAALEKQKTKKNTTFLEKVTTTTVFED